MSEWIKNRKWLVIFGALVLLGAAGFATYKLAFSTNEVESGEELQTARIRRGDLILYASGSGTLITMNEVALGFGTSGSIAELNVQLGDSVAAGDTLAVQGDQDELEAVVASDELAVLNAEQSLENLYSQAELVAAQAQLDLANARDALRDAEYDYSVNQQGNRASEATLEAAEAELTLAEEALDRARQQLDADPDNALSQLNYANAEKRYNTALWNWNWYTGSPSDIEQAQLEAQVALARAIVAQKENDLEKVKDGLDPLTLRQAELELANARAKLAISRQNLAEAAITAPFDGTIMAVNAEVGDQVTGPFITIADLSQRYLEIFLDETDMALIEPGYEVEVIFDALPERIFAGHVISVDPSLYETNQITAVRAIVQLDLNTNKDAERLMIGMNAAVDVIGGRAEGAVLVPVEALRELGPEEYAVFVLEDNQPLLRAVELGIMDYSYAEALSGLEAGEIVTTGIVETQ
ncbi:MAG: efflux RND transporter periplasmic adaptor subunit [Anaerolineales bacterium]|nr:efflux RND transporter periplasmic adaptor subunit [Anaerolineales bacterium]